MTDREIVRGALEKGLACYERFYYGETGGIDLALAALDRMGGEVDLTALVHECCEIAERDYHPNRFGIDEREIVQDVIDHLAKTGRINGGRDE